MWQSSCDDTKSGLTSAIKLAATEPSLTSYCNSNNLQLKTTKAQCIFNLNSSTNNQQAHINCSGNHTNISQTVTSSNGSGLNPDLSVQYNNNTSKMVGSQTQLQQIHQQQHNKHHQRITQQQQQSSQSQNQQHSLRLATRSIIGDTTSPINTNLQSLSLSEEYGSKFEAANSSSLPGTDLLVTQLSTNSNFKDASTCTVNKLDNPQDVYTTGSVAANNMSKIIQNDSRKDSCSNSLNTQSDGGTNLNTTLSYEEKYYKILHQKQHQLQNEISDSSFSVKTMPQPGT